VCLKIREAVSIAPEDRGVMDDAGGHAWVMADFQEKVDETVKGHLLEEGMI